MKCHEAKRQLDLFMDGELSVQENLKVLEHLNLCVPCASVYEGEKGLRAMLRSQLGSERAPEGLAERLVSSLAESAPAQPGVLRLVSKNPGRGRIFSAVAAAAFFLLALLFVLTTPGEKPRAFAAELATKHKQTHDGFCGLQRDDCLCVCSHCSSESENPVGKFFQRQVGTQTCVHDLSDLGYRVIGASVWRHRGRPVCWTVQRDEAGHTITHGLITTKIAMEPGPLLLCDGVDRPVVLIPREGTDMTCVFVFDDEGEAQRFRASRNLK